MTGKKAQAKSVKRQREAPSARPWDRRPEESPQAFKAFLAYRDCGDERTLAKAAEMIGKSRGMLFRWSTRHDWVGRCFLWDQEQYREAEAAVRQVRQQSLQRQVQDADRLQRLGMARLGKLVQRNPQTGELELDPGVGVQDAVRIYKLGLDIERSLPGASETAPAEEVEESELQRMSDEELRQLIALARQRVKTQPEEDDDGS